MPVYDFSFAPKMGDGLPESQPIVPNLVPNQPNANTPDPLTDTTNTLVGETQDDILVPGMKTMDRGVKEFFKDLQVPTKDGVKSVVVRLAGGDKTILFWKQELETGRVELPVMSINCTGWQFNPNKFSPAHMPAYKFLADRNGSKMGVMPREYPLLANYTLSVWAEKRRDLEYIVWQVVTRFNPVAEWTVQDEFMRGNIYATMEGVSNNTDIDVNANELSKVRADINIKIEGWMPLPAKYVPTVLGQIQTVNEITGEFLEIFRMGSGNQNITSEGQ